MRVSSILWQVLRFFLPLALIGTTYLFVYPLITGCSFPTAPLKAVETECWVDERKVPTELVRFSETPPFRLLTFGDPQLEGDTSLPDPKAPIFPSLWNALDRLSTGSLSDAPSTVAVAVAHVFIKDVPRIFQAYRKRLDLWGNDHYLAHIYRTTHWWTNPTHTAVLGDLLGSQWIGDGEFDRRSVRFWDRVFRGAEKVPDHITGLQGEGSGKKHDTVMEVLEGPDLRSWKNRLINVAGNHDIGYAGDIDDHRIQRFENTFGKVNWDIRFRLPSNETEPSMHSPFGAPSHPPELRLIILNDMNLDSPAWKTHLQGQTRDFLNDQSARTSMQGHEDAVILLTHIPLFKEEGICKDSSFFSHFSAGQGGGIMEQNHLTQESSSQILNGLFSSNADPAKRRHGVIINGHDHEGCDTFHYTDYSPHTEHGGEPGSVWETSSYDTARPLVNDKDIHGIREVTVRSMMGEFGGNAGLVSAWFDKDTRKWVFAYTSCPFGVQHIWWAVNGLDLFLVLLAISAVVAEVVELRSEAAAEREKEKLL